MQLSNILRDIEIQGLHGNAHGQVSSICYDSRKCEENCLFVAIPGLKTDGHHYIPEALDRGARFIVYEHDFTPPAGITAIQVGDSRRILGVLGKNFFGHPSAGLYLIAVTGTNGKTTVTYILESIIKTAGFNPGVLGTVNYRYGGTVMPAPNTTPESFDMQRILRQMLDAGVSHVIAEVSSHAVDLQRVDDCDFDLGIFTNLSQDHLDYHGNMERYFSAKKRFFADVLPRSQKGRPIRMIVNRDDPWGRRLLSEVPLPSWSFGIETPGDIHVESFTLTPQETEALVCRHGGGSFHISSSLIGRHNLYNILAAVVGALALGITEKDIIAGIGAIRNVPGRLERVNLPGEPDVFVDYAHTEDALEKVLQNLSSFQRNRIITVFGCGGDRDRGKRPLMGRAAVTLSDLTLLTSDNPRSENPIDILKEIEAGIPKEGIRKFTAEEMQNKLPEQGYTVIPDRRTAIEIAIGIAEKGDIVLIAGKGHEDYQLVGAQRLSFDDRLVAREALTRIRGEKGNQP
ncbi:MAG: UDP-N-acetylmuramoyl-L-alanyl-D-glutamate--2,6-diaminopimelate ligase [Syntrophales bacterium]|jgi:UDP-N-acetylmuramoyl-L-alanyl-D-glutamate--2,6-diaminopimelate ligase|nr:UDP-N-acetylmuramoyl-L-alanyl-D-glutamate--2,6-diaminopimelate ligase [Syntrophales bacterium]